MSKVVAVIDATAVESALYGFENRPDREALKAALRNAVDEARVDHDAEEFAALLAAVGDALHRYVATPEGRCPNYGEATESCDCLVCRTQTVLTEWEDEPAELKGGSGGK